MSVAAVAPFSSQHLAAIFGHTIFTSHNFRSSYQYWIPLISLYSGLRPLEAAQLHLEDIKCQDDIDYFDVNDTSPRKLKSLYSLRRVPIHSALIDLGFLVFIEELKKADEKVLFPELWNHSVLNIIMVSKRFKIILDEVGVVGIGLSGSSFRRNVADVYTQLAYNQDITCKVLGILTKSITFAIYAAPTSLSTLQKAVEVLNFSHLGVNVISLVKPWVTGSVERSKMRRKMQYFVPGIELSAEDLNSAVMSMPQSKKRRV